MINYDLKRIRAVIFDIDGVLSAQTITLHPSGDPLRTVNIKDGYALQYAVKCGLHVVILSGAHTESLRKRYEGLGIKDIYLKAALKMPIYEEIKKKYELTDEEVLYMGDDIPDLEVMRNCGCPCCPADAAPEVIDASVYVSKCQGGQGCARDVLEQVLRAQDLWLKDDKAFGW